MAPMQESVQGRERDGGVWPGARPYDVVFYRSFGPKAQINIASQHVWDPRNVLSDRKFTHCALVGSELTAMEAYPRAVEGPFTRLVHPGGVRFVPVADLCANSSIRYRDFVVLRSPETVIDSVQRSAEAMALGWDFLRHRYGLRRFFGLRHMRFPGEPVAEAGTEWLSCADIVQKVLHASGRFGVARREVVGPVTLFSELRGLGWRDVTADYAPDRFEAKRQRYESAAGQAALDIFAVRVAWVVGSLSATLREQQYRLERLINAQFALAGQGGALDEAIALLDTLRGGLSDEPARSAESLMADLRSRRGLLK